MTFQRGLLLLLLCSAAQAHEYGPDPRYTGAPGDHGTCLNSSCHVGTLNPTVGSIKIVTPSSTTSYTPGQAMTIQVTITDSSRRAYGFQLTARLASNTSSGQAGDFAAGSDGLTQVLCDNGATHDATHPCPTQFPVQFIEHTLQGYQTSLTASGAFTYTFTWTPPAATAGNVILYAAANAGPAGSPTSSSADVYTTNITLTPAAVVTSPAPTISTGGVVPIFSASTTIQPGSWISIYGSNFASGVTLWNGDFPTQLGGVTVSIDGKPAYIWFVSAGQINVQVPDDANRGTINVTVSNAAGVSNTVTANLQTVAPAFLLFDATHATGVIPTTSGGAYAGGTYDLLGPTGALGFNTRPAKKGETILLYGVGFGPTNPVVAAGKAYSGAAATTNAVTMTIGGISANVQFAGITSAGLYQFNVVVPSNAPSGDQALVAFVAGVSTATQKVVVTVQ